MYTWFGLLKCRDIRVSLPGWKSYTNTILWSPKLLLVNTYRYSVRL